MDLGNESILESVCIYLFNSRKGVKGGGDMAMCPHNMIIVVQYKGTRGDRIPRPTPTPTSLASNWQHFPCPFTVSCPSFLSSDTTNPYFCTWIIGSHVSNEYKQKGDDQY